MDACARESSPRRLTEGQHEATECVTVRRSGERQNENEINRKAGRREDRRSCLPVFPPSCESRLFEFAATQRSALEGVRGDHEALDLARAFVDLGDARVAVVALD